MTSERYPDELSMRAARDRYFADNGFSEAGYTDPWVELKIGKAVIPFPNSKSRAKAVPYHDLHHVVTGYGTDLGSEAVISAWEVGSGCGTNPAAWIIDLAGMGFGLGYAPRATYQGFLRGRRSGSLYGQPFEPLLDKSVGELRRELALPADDVPLKATAGDRLAFAGALLGAAVALPTILVGTLALLPFGLAALASRRGRSYKPEA